MNLARNFDQVLTTKRKKTINGKQVKSTLNIQMRRPQKVAAGCGENAIESQRINRPPNNHFNSRRDEVEKKSEQ